MKLSDATYNSSTAYMRFTLPDNSTQIVYVNQQTDANLAYAANGDTAGVKIFKCRLSAKYVGCPVPLLGGSICCDRLSYNGIR